jgi:hypothetical protein
MSTPRQIGYMGARVEDALVAVLAQDVPWATVRHGYQVTDEMSEPCVVVAYLRTRPLTDDANTSQRFVDVDLYIRTHAEPEEDDSGAEMASARERHLALVNSVMELLVHPDRVTRINDAGVAGVLVWALNIGDEEPGTADHSLVTKIAIEVGAVAMEEA